MYSTAGTGDSGRRGGLWGRHGSYSEKERAVNKNVKVQLHPEHPAPNPKHRRGERFYNLLKKKLVYQVLSYSGID
jgi:hypothetical protein